MSADRAEGQIGKRDSGREGWREGGRRAGGGREHESNCIAEEGEEH